MAGSTRVETAVVVPPAVLRFDPRTREAKVWTVPTGRALPYGMVNAPDGSIWVALFGTNKLGHIDAESGALREITLPQNGARPRRIAVDEAGVVWYTDFARGYLGSYNPKSGAFSERLSPGGASSAPYGIAIAPDGRIFYDEARNAMGGQGPSLAAALTYSNIAFSGAILIWVFNSLANVIRGTGNMAIPAAVTSVGAAALIPLSPCLIFGWGPLPRLGVAGGAVAVVIYYAVGSLVLAGYLWMGRSVVRLSFGGVRFRWPLFRDILKVGAVAALITVQTNLTIAIATGFAGRFGPAAIAGYGTGARLEYLLVPLVFGLGGPLVAMVGTNIGAGQRGRALRTAWIGAAIAAGLTELIGLGAALAPHVWLSLFDTDPAMLDAGSRYLHTVGPLYGLFGLGMALGCDYPTAHLVISESIPSSSRGRLVLSAFGFQAVGALAGTAVGILILQSR